MPISLDGFEVFQQVGKHADLFAAIRADVDKQARALIVKCLKAKAVGLATLCDIRKALGGEQFGLVLDGLKDAELKSVLTRLDKHHPELKQSDTAWKRDHLNALADGTTSPHDAPAKAKKASAKKAKSGPSRLESAVVDAYREADKKAK
jgi:hypothetical protein